MITAILNLESDLRMTEGFIARYEEEQRQIESGVPTLENTAWLEVVKQRLRWFAEERRKLKAFLGIDNSETQGEDE